MSLSIHHLSQRSRSSRTRQAFTLTELFICLTIVFVVVLVLYPVFAPKGRCRGCQSSGASNQKQIALAFLQYIQDYDEHFPPGVGHIKLPAGKGLSPAPAGQFAQSWGPDRKLRDGRIVPGLINPYIKSNQLFLDPLGGRYDDKSRILEYMYNDLLIHQDQENVANVAVTVLTTDSENKLANVGHAYTPDAGPYSAVFNAHCACDAGKGASIRSARFRHTNGANVAFTDGHVKWFKGGPDDQIFFPLRDSASVSAVDPVTKQQIDPKPKGDMIFQGRHYLGTFHIR